MAVDINLALTVISKLAEKAGDIEDVLRQAKAGKIDGGALGSIDMDETQRANLRGKYATLKNELKELYSQLP